MIEVRASMLPGYSDCARRSAARQFKKEITAAGYTLRETVASAGANLGTALHAVAAELLRVRREETIISQDHISAAIEQAWEGYKGNTRQGVEWDATTKNSYEASQQLQNMAYSIVPSCQSMNPEYIETKFSARVPTEVLDIQNNPIEMEFSGTLDVLEKTALLTDHKTGARIPSPWAQVGGYALICEANGVRVEKVAMLYVPRTRTDVQPAPLHLELDGNEAKRAAWSTLEDIARHREKFDRTRDIWAFPANPMSMMCTPKYCPAYDTDACRVGKKLKGDIAV